MVKQSSLTPNEYLHIKTLHLIVFFTKNLTYNQFKSLKLYRFAMFYTKHYDRVAFFN
ncbi:hypothetical protein THOD04_20101 [Vibrio owensii]|nr:hypothetical protein THOD04_20101 [Vibrio owensii]